MHLERSGELKTVILFTGSHTIAVIIISFNLLFYIFCVIYFFFRNAGDEWLVTFEDTEMYIPEVSEVSFMYI